MQTSFAQMNLTKYDERVLNFGFTIGYNNSNFRAKLHPDFFGALNDTLLEAESSKGPGFNIGIIADVSLNDYFSIRFVPSLSFAEKELNYTVCNGTVINGVCSSTKAQFQSIESIYTALPLLLKYQSKRLKNTRVYIIGGAKYTFDWASNAEARNADDIVKINKNDIALDYGVGFDFYLTMVKVAVELKASYGLTNVLARDVNLIYSRAFDRLSSRSFLLSIHFEG